MASKKLFLIDAMALIYRAHFAFIKNPRITTTGINTSAVFGFTNTLLEVLQKEKPTHLAVAFDLPGPTFRHIQYNQYKANRQEQPEDITVAIPYVKRLVKAMNIPLLELAGFEADDIIGTIAKKAARHDFEVYMFTPDKDYGQLVEENIFLYKPAMMGNSVEVMGVKEILEKWDIKRIDQVIDMLGLMGDKVDNIPGIAGVGEKTAAKFLAMYDSVEGILENADKIEGKIGEKIRDGRESAILSKDLARIDINVPVEFDEHDLEMCAYNNAELTALFEELEFRTLIKRMIPDAKVEKAAVNPINEALNQNTPASSKTAPQPSKKGTQISLFESSSSTNQNFTQEELQTGIEEKFVSEKDTIDTKIHQYHLIDSPELRASLIEYLGYQDEFCFDTETTNIDATDAELVGLSFSYRTGEAYYVPVPHDQVETRAIVQEFKEVFENEQITKIGQNVKYDLMILNNYGVELKGKIYDTMLAHYIIEPEQRHGMDFLANNYLNYEPVHIEELIGKKGKNQGSMRDVAPHLIKDYAAEDADVTLQLKSVLHPLLVKNEQEKLFNEIEIPLVRVLAGMEMEGVKVDVHALYELSATLEKDIQQHQKRIFELSGEEFNIASPKQLGEVLFEKLKIEKNPKKTATGQYATGEDILMKYDNQFEIVKEILDFRELQKLKSTYVDALPNLISKKTNRIHTSYNQAVTATGRLSSTNPNLQNIPIRTERGREIRKAFVPRNEDYVLLSADYSQIELRIMAAFSGDDSMIEAFNQGIDIHSTTASKVFKVALEDVSSDMRRKAKMVNFGIIYGISAFGLADRLGISRSEAKEIIDAYFVEFPKVKTFMDSCIQKARETEYVETILGRRRYLRDINSRNQTNRGFAERNAINAPIQGSAADMIKVAMIHIHEFLKKENLQSKMILQVHDELIFDVHHSEIDLMKEKINELMVNAIPMQVKMETGLGIGKNWLEAH